eukprot:NODE_93_length_21530_cov_0.700387.p2 type:complete len:669 gc:universal NODE_93_length_21530_cov_0.700387:17365-19371(+)
MLLFILLTLWGIIHLLQRSKLHAVIDVNLYLKIILNTMIFIMTIIFTFVDNQFVFEAIFHLLLCFIIYKDHLYTECSSFVLLYLPVRFLLIDFHNLLLSLIPLPFVILICILEYKKHVNRSKPIIYQSLIFLDETFSFKSRSFNQNWMIEGRDPSLFCALYFSIEGTIKWTLFSKIIEIVSIFTMLICFKYFLMYRNYFYVYYSSILLFLFTFSSKWARSFEDKCNLDIWGYVSQAILQKSLVVNQKYFYTKVHVPWSQLISLLSTIMATIMLIQLDQLHFFILPILLLCLIYPAFKFITVFQSLLIAPWCLYVDNHMYISILVLFVAIIELNRFLEFVASLSEFYKSCRDLKNFLMLPPVALSIEYTTPVNQDEIGSVSLNNIVIHRGTEVSLIKKNLSSIKVGGKIAFLSKKPFIVNASVRKNILFFQSFDKRKYFEVLYFTGLYEALKETRYKDLTLVNPLTNLSLLKKIQFARFFYSQPDIQVFESSEDFFKIKLLSSHFNCSGVTRIVVPDCNNSTPIFRKTSVQQNQTIGISIVFQYIFILSGLCNILNPLLFLIYIPVVAFVCSIYSAINFTQVETNEDLDSYYNHVIDGFWTVKAYSKENHFIAEFEKRINDHFKSFFKQLMHKQRLETALEVAVSICLVLTITCSPVIACAIIVFSIIK